MKGEWEGERGKGKGGRKGGVSAGSKPSQGGKEGDTVCGVMIPKTGGGSARKSHTIAQHSTANYNKPNSVQTAGRRPKRGLFQVVGWLVVGY